MARRRGFIRSVARTAGRTALIAGTATAVSGRVANRQNQKWAAQHDKATPAAAATTPNTGDDLVGRLQQLADLRDAGALTDKEFVAAKARLLQG
jgi:predicted transcriptional regulator